EQNGSSRCLPCKEDEYIEYPNDFSKCLGCRTCREDQVELSPCRAVSDTQCACKNGTFCSPDHPCEMCQKCKPRCPKDEVELAPCTPHSDRQCGPPTGTFSGSSSKWGAAEERRRAEGRRCELLLRRRGAAPHAHCFIHFRHCDHDRRGGGSCGPGCAPPLHLVLLLPEREKVSNPAVNGAWGTAFVPGLGGCYRTMSSQGMVPRTSYPSVKPRRNLVPVQGGDPTILLENSFEIFAQEVPCKDWKRYARALGLRENDIALAEMNDKYSLELFFQMLHMWKNRRGMNASVNTLLETLHQINLGGIAEDISSKLVQQGSFQHEVS
ncbi:TR10B factor, partial [Balaeniceps rex]|nr:TR10B factor [Balaeniceps rex]